MPVYNHVSIFMGDYTDMLEGVRFKENLGHRPIIMLDWKTTIYFKSVDDVREFVKIIQVGLENIK